jgi:hypothetical protein
VTNEINGQDDDDFDDLDFRIEELMQRIRRSFPNIVTTIPPANLDAKTLWKQQMEADMAVETSRANVRQLMLMMQENHIVCHEDFTKVSEEKKWNTKRDYEVNCF